MGDRTFIKAELTTIYVDDDNAAGPWDGTSEHPYQNITNGIEHASAGDTIFVFNGIYVEHVNVNKSVSLFGETRDSTIVDGNGTLNVINMTASFTSIEGFTITGSGNRPFDCGIFVDHSAGNDISYNRITGNHDGIRLNYASNNVASGNMIADNDNGVSLYFSSNNVVSGNTIFSNNYGVSLYFSSNNVVSGNTIFSNSYYGIYLFSGNNFVYHNNLANRRQIWIDSTNFWDDGNEGNYWSNHTGQDLDEDGIGDNPYAIDLLNMDNHPLMGRFSDFKVNLKGETFIVTTICNSTVSSFKFETGLETGSKIVHLNVTGEENTIGFCRVKVPLRLMNYPIIVLVDEEEIVPTILDLSNEEYVYLYFTYSHSSVHNITLISSRTQYLYNELLAKHDELTMEFNYLNLSYYDLLNNYGVLLNNFSKLQESYGELNNSCRERLLDYSNNILNTRNLMYIFAAMTAIFIVTTIYLAKHVHTGKIEVIEDEN